MGEITNGLTLIRFTNQEIHENLDEVISTITLKADEILSFQNSNESQ